MLRKFAVGTLLLAVAIGMGSCYVPPPAPPVSPPPPAVAPPPAVTPAPAPPRADIPGQIANQQTRINQGVRSGQLTRREAAVLQDNLNWIRAEHSRLSARGLTPPEYNMLERRLQQNDQMIRSKRHNPVRRLY